jgi:WD40 repeat protein
VRCIAYSGYGKVLFSTADNGVVRKWNLNYGKSESSKKVAGQNENNVSTKARKIWLDLVEQPISAEAL